MSGEEHSRQREQHREDFEAGGCGVCLRTSKEAGAAGAGKTRAVLVGDGAAWPIERTLLFSLSKEEAAEGLSRGLTCFDIHLRGIVWATTWRRPWRWKRDSSQAAADRRVRQDLRVGLVSEAARGRILDGYCRMSQWISCEV